MPVTFGSAVLGNLSGAQATIQSTGTATVTYTSNGTAGSGSVNAVVDNVPSSDAIAKASLTVNVSPSISSGPVATTSLCNGNNVSFNVTATGTLPTYQWFKGTTALANGTTGTGSTISGVTTNTLNIINVSSSDNSTNYNVVVKNNPDNSCSITSGNASLNVASATLAGSTTTGNISVSAANTVINDASCMLIAKVLPSGAAPVSGNVTARVTIDGSQQNLNGQPYLVRHYDIEPATSPNTGTATLTLYFLQSEFNTYNAAMSGTVNDLPTGPSDAIGKANLRISQMHGTSGSSTPGSYTGWGGVGPPTVLINPGAANVVWNGTENRWEVTFTVIGFSGFFVTGLINFVLPVQLESFSGSRQGNNVQLNWMISEETNVSLYEIEMSDDGVHFTNIRDIPATNKRNYSMLSNIPGSVMQYYRLKIIDTDGRTSYSNVIAVGLGNKLSKLLVSPNPFHDKLLIDVELIRQANTLIFVSDISGKILFKQNYLLTQGTNTIMLHQLNRLINGTYMLHVANDEINKTIKIVKFK